jgi:hypothetical protein
LDRFADGDLDLYDYGYTDRDEYAHHYHDADPDRNPVGAVAPVAEPL